MNTVQTFALGSLLVLGALAAFIAWLACELRDADRAWEAERVAERAAFDRHWADVEAVTRPLVPDYVPDEWSQK